MAFVMNKSQTFSNSPFKGNSQVPGPGSYLIQNSEQKELPAPFNSSNYRMPCFSNSQNTENLGPGVYKNANSTIGDCYKKIKVQNKCPFNSKLDRWRNQKQRSALSTEHSQNFESKAQPEDQSLLEQQRSLKVVIKRNPEQSRAQLAHADSLNRTKQCIQSLRRTNQSRRVNSIESSSGPSVRVLLSNPSNTEQNSYFYVQKDIVDYTNGPGKYEIAGDLREESPLKKCRSVIAWSKDKSKRCKYGKKRSLTSTEPGPGQYELNKSTQSQLKKQNRLSSSFSYSGIRSYMDTLIYKTNNEFRAKILEAKRIKDKQPGPGHYQTSNLQKSTSFYCGEEILGSKVDRFTKEGTEHSRVGPGFYKNIDRKKEFENKLKETRKKIFSKQNHITSYPLDNVTPLEQQIKATQQELTEMNRMQRIACTLKDRCHSKLGSISQGQRFKEISSSNPGPADYCSTRKPKDFYEVLHNPASLGKKHCSQSVFSSKVQRSAFETKQNNEQIPFYDIGKTDISYKTNKLKNHIEELKKVSIHKAPFQSTVSRFCQPGSDIKNSKTLKNHDRTEEPHQQMVVQISDKRCKTEHCPSSAFASQTNRDIFCRKEASKQPGPGSYSKEREGLLKKSFNVQYSEDPVFKKKARLMEKQFQNKKKEPQVSQRK